MQKKKGYLIFTLGLVWLTACRSAFALSGQSAPQSPAEIMDTNTLSGFSIPSPTALPTPTHTPTPPEPVLYTATVWQEMPQVPILMYHRFDPHASYNYTTSLSDFDGHLSTLYEAGFSLVALDDWLDGEIHLQEGRRPLIITIDDLFYADQLSLDENGQPASYSGVGRLWQFSQDHPDFNFHTSLFYNFGDKGYANVYQNGVFLVQDGWRQSRAEAIAWGIKHGAIPMNHFYDHPFLNQLSPAEIQWQLEENDRALREALALVGKEKYADRLPNVLALPYVVWPATEAGKQILYDYVSPEGTPVAAILEANLASGARLLPAPFAPNFDPWHVPRINAGWLAIDIILGLRDDIPIAGHCELGFIDPDPASAVKPIMGAILEHIEDGRCPAGIFVVEELIFQADETGIIQLQP